MVIRLLGLLVSIGLAAGLGWGMGRVSINPPLRSLAALVLGWTLGSCIAAGVWLKRPPPEVGILGVSVIVSLNHLAVLALLVVGALVHFTLGSGGSALAAQRAVIMAEVGALWGWFGFARNAGALHPLR